MTLDVVFHVACLFGCAAGFLLSSFGKTGLLLFEKDPKPWTWLDVIGDTGMVILLSRSAWLIVKGVYT